jgi:hypothetical protein
MKHKIISVLILLTVSCGASKEGKRNEAAPQNPIKPSIPLLQGVSEASLWDYSSEIRCDGFKEFLSTFVKQQTDDGMVTQFSCMESLPGSEAYAATAELTVDSQKVILSIAAYRTASDITFCAGEFAPVPNPETCPASLPESKSEKIIALRNDLPVLFNSFVTKEQTKDLVYGMSPSDFKKVAFNLVSSTDGVSVPINGQNYQLFFELTPSVTDLAVGDATIKKIEPENGYQIFGCADSDCLSKRKFDYRIVEHWFKFSSDGKLSAFVIPKPN